MTCYIQLKNKTLTVLKSFLIVVIFSLINLTCLTQTNDIELLKKEIENSKSDHYKVDLLIKLSKHYSRSGKIDSALLCINRSLVLAKKNNNQQEQFIAYKYLGNIYQNIGEKDNSLNAYQKALTISKNSRNKKQESDILDKIGIHYEGIDDYKKALSFFLTSLRLKESIHYRKGIAISYDYIGIIYCNENNYTKSLSYYFKSLKIKKELADSVAMGITFHNIAYVYECQQKIDKAIKMYLLAIKIKKDKNSKNDLAISYNNLGSCYDKLGLKDSAFYYHKKSFDINLNCKREEGIALSAHALAGDLFNRHELEAAMTYAKLALNKSTKGGNLFIKKSVYSLISDIYNEQHLFELALKYNKLSQTLNDSIYNLDSQRTIAEMNTKYETEKKEIENKNLHNQNQIKSLEINNQRIFIASLILLILVIIFVSWLISSRKEFKQKEHLKSELLNQNEIRTKSIIEGQEIERKRMAMDLHDGVGQTLAGVKMNMASMIDRTEFSVEVITAKIISTMQLVDGAYKEVRELAHQMMPKTLSEKGLEEAIDGLLEKTLVNTSVVYSFEKNNYTRLEENIELALYRIFQELLTNILKHANATRVVISLHITKLHIILMVEDNGIGIEPNDGNIQGIGLSNIQARITMLNGTFSINRGDTEGTIAVIRIPFDKKYLVP